MFKRRASKPPVTQTRKRRRNGISTSRAALELAETPLDLPQLGMRVWQTKAEEPRVVRKSVIPLQPTESVIQLEDLTLPQAEDTVPEVMTPAGQKKRKRVRKRVRKQGNDSVSPPNLHFCRLFNSFNRRKCRISLAIGCGSSMKSYDTTAFKSTPHLLRAPTALTTLACTGV